MYIYTFIDTSISTDIYTNDHQLHLLQLALLIIPERTNEQLWNSAKRHLFVYVCTGDILG